MPQATRIRTHTTLRGTGLIFGSPGPARTRFGPQPAAYAILSHVNLLLNCPHKCGVESLILTLVLNRAEFSSRMDSNRFKNEEEEVEEIGIRCIQSEPRARRTAEYLYHMLPREAFQESEA